MKRSVEEETRPTGLLGSFVRFGIVGLVATTIQYALLIALVSASPLVL